MWKQKLILKNGETLGNPIRTTKGTLGQEEIEQYDVLDAEGKKIGMVKYTEHTALRAPSRTTFHLVQRDDSGVSLVDFRW